jgi:bla regulator protein blaR1
MKPGIALLAIPLTLGIAIAQIQPSATASEKTSDSPVKPSSEHIYGPKEGAKAPKVTYSPDPTYPRKAHKPRNQDTVVLWLIVGSDGLPRDIKIARSLSPEFDESAIDAVKKWKFAPGTKDGKPVACQMNIEIEFRR